MRGRRSETGASEKKRGRPKSSVPEKPDLIALKEANDASDKSYSFVAGNGASAVRKKNKKKNLPSPPSSESRP